jgi:hypothetical protein
VTRLFQQFSRFKLGKESAKLGQTQHHFLKQDKVGQSGNILKPLALELGQPAEGFREAEETIRCLLLAWMAGAVISAALSRSHVRPEHIMTSVEAPRACSVNLPVAFPQAGSDADCPFSLLLEPSRSHFRATLWCSEVARVSRQFSRFSSTSHDVAALIRKFRHIQLVLGLLARAGDVQRPGGRDARLARLDELGDGDVDDGLAAGLGAGDAEQAVDLTAGTLARRPRELVPEQGVPFVTRQ